MNIKYLILIFFLSLPFVSWSKEPPRGTLEVGFDLGTIPMKSANIVLDQAKLGFSYAVGPERNFTFFARYNGLFGRLTPFMNDGGTPEARSFSLHNFTIGTEVTGANTGVGLSYSHKRVYNIMHPYFSTMKSFNPADSAIAEDGDFNFSTVDFWFYLGKPQAEHLMFGASIKDGVFVQFQVRMAAGHQPFLYMSMRGHGVKNAHLSPEFYTTLFGVKLVQMELPMIGRAALTPYVAYRLLKNADYRFAPMNYGSINIGIEVAYGF